MSTYVSETDLNRESCNPSDAFAPMTEEKMEEFHHALEGGFNPVFQVEERATQGKVLVIDFDRKPLSEADRMMRESLRAALEAEVEGREGIVRIYENDEVQASNLEHEMRAVAAKQLETDPDGDGPPVVEQVIRAAYQDENPPKEALKEILLAAQKPMSLIIKDMLANAREVKVLDKAELANCGWIDVAPSESRGPLKIISPQIAQRHPEWAAAVLDGLDVLERDYPDLAFFYTLAVFTDATAIDLAELFETPFPLVHDDLDEAHAILLRIIGERVRVGVLS
jgi:hypothetical protein